MGQKVNPHGLRVGINKDWSSKWYANGTDFATFLAEDNEIRKFIKNKLYKAGVANVVIERTGADKIKIIAQVARPGIVVGRNGEGIAELKKSLIKKTGKDEKDIAIDVVEVKRAELDATLTAESIAEALERRVSFRRAMKQAIQRTMKANAKGIKVLCSGRLGGAEIARSEKYSEGNVPLHTLRANIDYGFAEADTTYGKIGVKVWINHGEILDKGLRGVISEANTNDKRDRRTRRNEKRDRKRSFSQDKRRNPREEKREIKPATTRVRKAPKVEPKVEEAAVEQVQDANNTEE